MLKDHSHHSSHTITFIPTLCLDSGSISARRLQRSRLHLYTTFGGLESLLTSSHEARTVRLHLFMLDILSIRVLGGVNAPLGGRWWKGKEEEQRGRALV